MSQPTPQPPYDGLPALFRDTPWDDLPPGIQRRVLLAQNPPTEESG